jgi:Rho GTPase-activating protein 1
MHTIEVNIPTLRPSALIVKMCVSGQVVSLQTFGDPHLAAVLLKKYLRDLPSPIFPETLYPIIKRTPPPIGDASEMAAIEYIRDSVLPELSPCTYILLNSILRE